MAKISFATFKYDHGGPIHRSFLQWLIGGVLLMTGVPTFFMAHFAIGIFLMLAGLIALFGWPKPSIQVGPRYLVCGTTVVYYANVIWVMRDVTRGVLTLKSVSGGILVLKRDKFTTGARKAHKIQINRGAKFMKVSSRIITQVRRASSDVEIVDELSGMQGTTQS